MKFQIKPFVLAFTILCSSIFLVLAVWNAISGFGKEIMDLLHSIYPNPFVSASFASEISFGKRIMAVFLDLFYVVVDSLIFSLALSYLYKLFYKEEKATSDIESTEEG